MAQNDKVIIFVSSQTLYKQKTWVTMKLIFIYLCRTERRCRDLFSSRMTALSGLHIRCSSSCKSSISTLYSSSTHISTCKCQSKECRVVQRRANRCLRGDIAAKKMLNLVGKDGCTYVFQKCHMDEKCRKIFNKVMRSCNSMLNGIVCTTQCEQALKNMLTHEISKRFVSCQCDGSQYFEGECLQIRDRITDDCDSKDFRSFLKNNKIKVVQLPKWKFHEYFKIKHLFSWKIAGICWYVCLYIRYSFFQSKMFLQIFSIVPNLVLLVLRSFANHYLLRSWKLLRLRYTSLKSKSWSQVKQISCESDGKLKIIIVFYIVILNCFVILYMTW